MSELTINQDDPNVKCVAVWLDHDNRDIHAAFFNGPDDANAWAETEDQREYKTIIVSMEYTGGGEWKLSLDYRT